LNFSQPKYLHLSGLVAVRGVGVIRLLICLPGLGARRRSPAKSMVLGCDRWARCRLYPQCVPNRAGVRAAAELGGPQLARTGSPGFARRERCLSCWREHLPLTAFAWLPLSGRGRVGTRRMPTLAAASGRLRT
jgi:hypothetical protein